MKNMPGFSISQEPSAECIASAPKENPSAVRSLVTVRFIKDGRVLTYYNDKFALELGDHVFVSGKLAGQLGIVEKITTKFKIKLADYQRVIAKASTEIHGTYESVLGKLLSYDREAMSAEDFRTWILPPAHWEGDGSEGKEDQVIIGDGYALDLSGLESNDDVSHAALERAFEYCKNGKVAYICVRDGIGTAFVEGTSWYEINFRLQGETLSEMYCDCPYPGLCKHLLALALTIRALVRYGNLVPDSNFVAIDKDWFWSMVAHDAKKITL